MKVYIGADHAGFALKAALIPYIRELGFTVEDCGAHLLEQEDDYPKVIRLALLKLTDDLREDTDSRAIVIGGSGQGEAIVANRFKGVRCALFYGSARTQIDAAGKELDMIGSTRMHNDANALSIGARFVTQDEAKDAVKKWLGTPFSKEARHVRRVWQIDES